MRPLLVILRVISSAVLAAGIAGLAAGIVSAMQGANAAPFARFGFSLAFVFIASATVSMLLMPARAALARRPHDEPPLMAPLVGLLVVLCGAAALQVPPLLAWLADDRARLGGLSTGRPDPLGLDLIPVVILSAAPALGLTTLLTFAITSVLAVVVPSSHASRVLAACVSLQAGLIVGTTVIARALHAIGTWAVRSMEARDAVAASDWVSRYDLASTSALRWAALTSVGYAVALALVRARTRNAAAPAPLPSSAAPPVVAPPVAAPSPVTAASSTIFDASNYAVRPRMTLVEALITRKISNYDVNTIPATTRMRFSFAWATGALRREPDGPRVLIVTPARAPGLLWSGSYEVGDEAGATVATLVPKGADWEIVDASTMRVIQVLRSTARRGVVTYHARMDDADVGTFRWALRGMSVMSAEMEVEFGPAPGLHRGVALVLGVILEQKARMASERR